MKDYKNIVKNLGFENVIIEDVINASPFTLKELKHKSREHIRVEWRALHSIIMYKGGYSLEMCGNMFNRDHATVISSFTNLTNKSYTDSIDDKIQAVKRASMRRISNVTYCNPISFNLQTITR